MNRHIIYSTSEYKKTGTHEVIAFPSIVSKLETIESLDSDASDPKVHQLDAELQAEIDLAVYHVFQAADLITTFLRSLLKFL